MSHEMERHIVFSSAVYLSVTLSIRSRSIEPLVGFTNNHVQMASMMRRFAVLMFEQGLFKVNVTI
jgi:hypothetical protein